MKLTAPEIIELIKTPAYKAYIEQAQKQEERLLMHTEPLLTENAFPNAFREFISWVGSILPADKLARFTKLLTFPLETVDSTESIFDELSKVFDTPDKYIKSEFTSPEYERDFLDYIASQDNSESFWENKGFNALKSGINSFIVVDLKNTDPAEQQSFRPEPYFYLLSISAVHDVMINERTGKVEYIIFNQSNGDIVALEETAFRRYRKDDAGNWNLLFENFHDLGFTPADSFYRHPIKGTRGINKRSPLTNSLSKLDWLLFFKTSKKYLDLYAAYPILMSYEQKCEYKDEHGNSCEAGFINYSVPNAVNGFTHCQKECPACAKTGFIGAGSNITVPAPRDNQDADMMNNGVKFIEPSNDKLDYNVGEIERLEEEIFLNSVGFMQEASKEAINEKQVKSQFESRITILNRIREQLEQNIQFTLNTMGRLRYGNSYSHSIVTLGNEYFLQSAEDIALQYTEAKKAGLPSYEVARIRETYSKTKFKNNPEQYERSFILAQLEPYPDHTVNELKGFGINASDMENFQLKLDFINYVAKFERDFMNIVDFGSLIDFGKKIEIIKEKLLNYVREDMKKSVKAEPVDPKKEIV
jgi:hypothetical protein